MQHDSRKHAHEPRSRTNPIGVLMMVVAVLFFAVLITNGMMDDHRGTMIGAGVTVSMAMVTSFIGSAIALTGCVLLLMGIAARKGLTSRDAAQWVLVILAGVSLASGGWAAVIGLAGLAGLLVYVERTYLVDDED